MRLSRMNGYEANPLLPLPIIQPARSTSTPTAKVHGPMLFAHPPRPARRGSLVGLTHARMASHHWGGVFGDQKGRRSFPAR
jgi:hypothetical protein